MYTVLYLYIYSAELSIVSFEVEYDSLTGSLRVR